MDLTVLGKLKSLARDVKGIFKISSDNDNRQVNITINLPGETVDPKTLEQAQQVLKEAIGGSQQFRFANEKTVEPGKLINNYLRDNSDDIAKDFIRKSIPEADKSIWFSALILRDEFNKGHNEIVTQIKNQMIMARMDRGRNIANLCSAGYLETLIIPLYQTANEKQDLKIFYEIYETIIVEYPFAVFVSSTKSYRDIKNEVINKIKHVKSYGWKKVSVHGIGEDNVKTIQTLAVEIRKECAEITNIDINSHDSMGKIITVSITIN